MTLPIRVRCVPSSSASRSWGQLWTGGTSSAFAIALATCILGVCCGPVCGEDGEEPVVEDRPQPVLRLCVMDADGGNLRQLEVESDYTVFGSPDWLADGTKIAADAYKAQEGESWGDSHVVVIDVEDGSLEDLGPGAMPSWSPRGNRIAFSQYTPDRGVCVMYADGSDRKLLDPSGWGIRWSPDGKQLAWTTRADGGANITVYDMIEGELKTILEGDHRQYSSIYWSFGWSPDGKRICFKGIGPSGPELAIVSVAGSSEGFKVRLREETQPDIGWHPSGKHFLIYKRCKERNCLQLYSVEADTEEPPKLVEGQDPASDNHSGDWSHDGKTIVFSSKKKPAKAQAAK